MAVPSCMPCKVVAALTNTPALIADDQALAKRIDALGDTVGIDTEFMRVRTFHPIPALYQLAGEDDVALVDAQAPCEFASLKALLQHPTRTKIMHAASEDLEVIAHHLDLRPTNLLDTQVAHAFLTPDFSASYATLVKRYAGVELDKHETRSDWLQRPLTAAQAAYAREDVLYLRPIWERQREALAASGRLAWFLDEMRGVLDTPAETPQTWYRNLNGIGRLSRRELAVLRSLVCWREGEARRRNVPRAWTVRDEALLVMAQRQCLRLDDVAPLLPKRIAQRYAKALLQAHRDGVEDAALPPPAPKPLGRAGNDVVKKLRLVAESAAQRVGMAAPLLARRRDLESAFRHFRQHGDLPTKFQGWRREVVGDALCTVLAATP